MTASETVPGTGRHGLIQNMDAFRGMPTEFFDGWQQDLEIVEEWLEKGCAEEIDPNKLSEYRSVGMQAMICGDRLHRRQIQEQLEKATGVDNIHFHMVTGGGAVLDPNSPFNQSTDRSRVEMSELEFMLAHAGLVMTISHIHVPCLRAFHTARVRVPHLAMNAMRGKAHTKEHIGKRDIYPDIPFKTVQERAERFKMGCGLTTFNGVDRRTIFLNEDEMLVWFARKYHHRILANTF